MKKSGMIFTLVLILCFTVGCQDKEAMAELEEFKAQAKVEEQNIELIKGLFEELKKGNAEIWKELCAPDLAYYSPSNSPEPMSLDETIECSQMAFEGFPDIYLKTHELIAKGDKVLAWFNETGTHEGEYHDIPATGNKIELGIITIFYIKEGKIVEAREEADSLGLMMQLGMELKPKEGEK
jgi:predicted ester cyclase